MGVVTISDALVDTPIVRSRRSAGYRNVADIAGGLGRVNTPKGKFAVGDLVGAGARNIGDTYRLSADRSVCEEVVGHCRYRTRVANSSRSKVDWSNTSNDLRRVV